MLAMSLAWLYLVAVTLPVGSAIVGRTNESPLLALWCGLFAQALLMQVLSAVLPLYPWGLITMPLLALVVAQFTDRRWFPTITRDFALFGAQGVAYFVLTLAIAYVASGSIVYYDSGLYHIPFLRWLARDGLVPGLGLLHIRFAIPSDWFAIASAFDAGPFRGRMAATVNGYIILLAITQVTMSASRIRSGTLNAGDGLIVGGFGLFVAHALIADTAVSVSPDLPVAALTILIGFIMLTSASTTTADESRAKRPLLVAFLAAMSVAIKLSAAPVFVVAVLFCLWRWRSAGRQLLLSAVIALGVLLPTIYASIILSGCPAFPLTIGCLALPWTISPSVAYAFQEGVTRFARWYAFPVTAHGAWGWIIPYFLHSGNRLNLVFVPLVPLVIGVEFFFPALRRKVLRGNGPWVVALGLADFVFVMMKAPDTRFAIGAIALIFGQAVEGGAAFFPLSRKPTANYGKSWAARARPILFATVAGLAVVSYRLTVGNRLDARRWAARSYAPILETTIDVPLSQRWLLPAPLPVIYGSSRKRDGTILKLASRSSADVTYGAPPIGDQCWGADIPCSPGAVGPIRLRFPSLGTDGGFVHNRP